MTHSTKKRLAQLSALLLIAASVGAIAKDVSSRRASAGTKESTRTFTVSEGTNIAIAVSPDRKSLAIDLQGRIWVLPVEGGAAKAITPVMEEGRYPAWSPKGDSIAYQCFIEYHWHICTVPINGAARVQHTSGPFDHREPQWSADGAQLIFSADRSRNYDIWSMNLVSKQLAPVTTDATEEYYPAVLAQPARLAYVQRDANQYRLIVQSAAGARALDVKSMVSRPSWSPDGKKVAYHRYDAQTGFGVIELMDIRSGEAIELVSDQEDIFPTGVVWLSNDEVLYGADGQIKRRTLGDTRTSVVPFSATLSVTRIQHPQLQKNYRSSEPNRVLGILRPSVSPDGKQIAFTALSDLWLLTVGDPVPRRLTNDAFLDVDAAWSPDGNRLAYVSDRRGTGTTDLYVRDMRSGLEKRVTSTVEDFSLPAWSPDGRSIAVYMMDSNDWHDARLYLVDVETGQMTAVQDKLFLPSPPSWSADGRTIAVMTRRPTSERFGHGNNSFFMIDVASKRGRFVSPDEDRSVSTRTQFGPIWSPDGTKVAYLHEDLLWVVPVDATGALTGKPRMVTREAASYPSWTGDSRSLVFLGVDTLKRVSIDGGQPQSIPLQMTWRRAIPQQTKVVQVGRLFDGKSNEYRKDVDIVIEGNVIKEVVARRDWPTDAQIIDARDQVVVPGLFQLHLHHLMYDGEKMGRLWLSFGITSVREPGAEPYEALERRESWASGARVGPRLFYSEVWEGTRVWYWNNIALINEAHLQRKLDRSLRLDYDFIKLLDRLPFDMQARIVKFAHANHLPVASHEIYPAAVYGADTVEHLSSSSRMEMSDRISLKKIAYQDAIQIMAQSGMTVVPTSAGRAPSTSFIAYFDANQDIMKAPQVQSFAPKYLKASEHLMAYQRKLYGERAQLLTRNEANAIKRLDEAGVTMGSGTDGGTVSAGYSLLFEIKHLADSGLGNAKALRAATLDAAQISGVDQQLGSIEPGKLADLVIVDGDPLRDILDLAKVKLVMVDGRTHALNDLLRAPALEQGQTH